MNDKLSSITFPGLFRLSNRRLRIGWFWDLSGGYIFSWNFQVLSLLRIHSTNCLVNFRIENESKIDFFILGTNFISRPTWIWIWKHVNKKLFSHVMTFIWALTFPQLHLWSFQSVNNLNIWCIYQIFRVWSDPPKILVSCLSIFNNISLGWIPRILATFKSAFISLFWLVYQIEIIEWLRKTFDFFPIFSNFHE